MTRCAPSWAKPRAMACPTRRADPVTHTTLSFRSSCMLTYLLVQAGRAEMSFDVASEAGRIHQHHVPSVRVGDCHPMRGPIGVTRWDRDIAHSAKPLDQSIDGGPIQDVKHQQGVR